MCYLPINEDQISDLIQILFTNMLINIYIIILIGIDNYLLSLIFNRLIYQLIVSGTFKSIISSRDK